MESQHETTQNQPIVMISYVDALKKNLEAKQADAANIQPTSPNNVRVFDQKKKNKTEDKKPDKKKYNNKKRYDSRRDIIIKKINKSIPQIDENLITNVIPEINENNI